MTKNATVSAGSVCALLFSSAHFFVRGLSCQPQSGIRWQRTRKRFQSLCALAVGMLLMLAGDALANFPPVLVIDGVASVCTTVKGVNGQPYAKYSVPNGVLILYGTPGGVAAWGATESEALSYGSNYSWSVDYSSSIDVEGHTIVFPQMLLYCSGTGSAPVLHGYDGVAHQALGAAPTPSGFVAAYNGFNDGYIFRFGSESNFYRYQAGPEPLAINKPSGSWPPSNVSVLPWWVSINDNTLGKTSFTEGFANGYWCNITYQGYNSSNGAIYGELHIYIAGDGSTGQMGQISGAIGGTTVIAQWDASTKMFVADSGLGINLNASPGTPQYGPPQVALHGFPLPFRYINAQGMDFYSDKTGERWVTVSDSYAVTAYNAGSTVTGTYNADPGNETFGPELGDCAIVNTGGTWIMSQPNGIWVITEGWNPGPMSFYSNSGAYACGPPDYTLYLPDGRTMFQYTYLGGGYEIWVWGLAQFEGSPIYYTGGGDTLDMTNGWAGSNVQITQPFPFQGYINGALVARTSLNGPSVGSFWSSSSSGYGILYTANYSGPGGSMTIESCDGHVTSANVNGTVWSEMGGEQKNVASFDIPFYDYNSGSELSIHVDLGPAPATPQFGPLRITWNGMAFQFSYGGGTDYYANPDGKIQIAITGSNVKIMGSHPVSGTYNPETYQFSFNGDPAMQSFLAQDAAGNLLGTPAGLTMYFKSTQSGFGQSIQLGDGTFLSSSNSTVYNFKRADGSLGVKYIGVPSGSLFVVADATGAFTSPVYRYNSNQGDLTLTTGSNGAWVPSNLCPPQLYVNGHYASIDSTSQISQGGSGRVSYKVQPVGETVTLSWTWGQPYGWVADYSGGWSPNWIWTSVGQGFSAVVSGNYSALGAFNGTWDGGKIFSGLPSGLVISVEPPSAKARYGPPQIKWNGVELIYDPLASAASSTNPEGADVYRDTLNLGLLAMVSKDGSVTLYGADGIRQTGTYDPNSYQFAINGQNAGVVQADTTQGFVLHSSGGRGPNDNQATTSATMEALGNFDIRGNTFSFGSWTYSGTSMPGMVLSFTSSQDTQPSLLQFSAARKLTMWTWSHAESDGGSNQLTSMSLDSSNRLSLFDPTPQTSGTTIQPTIVLDPAISGTSRIQGKMEVSGTMVVPGTVLIRPQGDLDMGQFTNGNAPQ